MAHKKKVLADLPVEFGGISLGKDTARIGVSIARSDLMLTNADELLVGHRLTCEITLDGSEDTTSGQQRLVDDLDLRIDGIADCKGMRVTPDLIAAGLTMSLRDLVLEDFAKFSKGKGRLIISGVAKIEVEQTEDDADGSAIEE